MTPLPDLPRKTLRMRTELAGRVVAALLDASQTVGLCESLTGGALGAALSAIPGASAVFRGGLITYATDLKIHLAGVDEQLVRDHGVVSEQVARAMARRARGVCGADWGVSTTGVAGPDEVDGHPAGTVWIAVCGPDDGSGRAQLLNLCGDRDKVRELTVAAALGLLRDQLIKVS